MAVTKGGGTGTASSLPCRCRPWTPGDNDNNRGDDDEYPGNNDNNDDDDDDDLSERGVTISWSFVGTVLVQGSM